MIRDTDYLNSLALRRSVVTSLDRAGDDNSRFFRALLDEGLIVIARSQGNSLQQVVAQMGPNARSPIIPDEWFSSDFPDVTYLESDRSPGDRSTTYSPTQATSYYARTVRQLLDQSLEPYLTDNFRARASDRVIAFLAEGGTLRWEFFRPNGEFWEGFSKSEHQEHMHFFDYVLGQAASVGFLPAALNLNPIYMHDVAEAIDLLRGRHLRAQELIESRTIRLGSGFSFSDYIDYLSVLPISAIHGLLACDENARFREACEQFSLQRVGFSEVEVAYTDYRRVVDSEIMRQSRTLPQSGNATDLRAFLRRTADEVNDHAIDIVAEELLGAVVPFWRLGLSLFYRILKGEWPDQKATRLARQAVAVEIAGDIADLQRTGEKLSARVISDAEGLQDRVVNARSAGIETDLCVAGASATRGMS